MFLKQRRENASSSTSRRWFWKLKLPYGSWELQVNCFLKMGMHWHFINPNPNQHFKELITAGVRELWPHPGFAGFVSKVSSDFRMKCSRGGPVTAQTGLPAASGPVGLGSPRLHDADTAGLGNSNTHCYNRRGLVTNAEGRARSPGLGIQDGSILVPKLFSAHLFFFI